MLSLSPLAPNTTDIAIATTDTADNETGNEKGGLVCSMAGTGNIFLYSVLMKQNHQMYVLHTYVVICEKLKILQWLELVC